MTKLIVTDFPYIKVNKISITNRKPIYGVGINDSNYQTQPTVNGVRIACKFYTAWKNMMRRCYSKKYQAKQPTYIGCIVDPIWHSFMSFRKWMIQQDWEHNHLDKDILVPGNKIYSSSTCIFVSQEINNLLTGRAACRGKYPMGVSWDKEKCKFVAQLGVNGDRKHLGYFSDEKTAHTAASKAKAEHIKNIAQTQSEPIRSALLRHAKLFSDGCDEKIKPCT